MKGRALRVEPFDDRSERVADHRERIEPGFQGIERAPDVEARPAPSENRKAPALPRRRNQDLGLSVGPLADLGAGRAIAALRQAQEPARRRGDAAKRLEIAFLAGLHVEQEIAVGRPRRGCEREIVGGVADVGRGCAQKCAKTRG